MCSGNGKAGCKCFHHEAIRKEKRRLQQQQRRARIKNAANENFNCSQDQQKNISAAYSSKKLPTRVDLAKTPEATSEYEPRRTKLKNSAEANFLERGLCTASPCNCPQHQLKKDRDADSSKKRQTRANLEKSAKDDLLLRGRCEEEDEEHCPCAQHTWQRFLFKDAASKKTSRAALKETAEDDLAIRGRCEEEDVEHCPCPQHTLQRQQWYKTATKNALRAKMRQDNEDDIDLNSV